MNKVNIRFLSGVLALCFCSISAAHAVPTVKRLGSNTAKIGSNASVVTAPTPTKSSTSSEPQRLSSVRSIGTTAAVPTNRVSGSLSSASDTNRLGFKIGPYVQTGNSISKGPKAMAPEQQPSEQPVVPSELNLHAGDEWILVDGDEISLNPVVIERITTLEELMPTKQNILTVGEGLSLVDDHLTLDLDLSQIEGVTYTGTYGIAVDNDTHQVKVDISDPVDGAMYVFQDGQWVILQMKYEWDPFN